VAKSVVVVTTRSFFGAACKMEAVSTAVKMVKNVLKFFIPIQILTNFPPAPEAAAGRRF